MQKKCWLLLAPVAPLFSSPLSVQFLFLFALVLSLSLFLFCPSFSPCFFSLLCICLLPAFHLWKLDDTTSPWTGRALSQLSYGLLFHEHHHYNFSSLPLPPSLFLFSLTRCLQQQWLKLMCNSMTPLTEVFNSFSTCKSNLLPLSHTFLPGQLHETQKKGVLKHSH